MTPDTDLHPLAETGWQTLRRYGREIVGDGMTIAAPWLYAIGAAGALFWWLA
jgi:hypothetical protein